MKFTISYDVECDTLDDVLKIIREIDNEMGIIPVKVRQELPPTDILIRRSEESDN